MDEDRAKQLIELFNRNLEADPDTKVMGAMLRASTALLGGIASDLPTSSLVTQYEKLVAAWLEAKVQLQLG